MQELVYSALKKFGLTQNETKVYLETLKKEELSPFQIARLTNIPRTSVYDILMNLSLKGLVELEQSDGIKKQQTLVRAKNPSVLRNILQQKRKELVETEADILNILPTIKEDFHKDKAGADFKFYPGLDGAKKVYFESLNFDAIQQYDNICVWDMQMPMDAFGIKEMNSDIDKGKRRGHVKELMPLNDWTKHVMTYQTQRNQDYLKQTEYRAIDDTSFNVFTRIQLAGNYIWIICAHENEMWGLVAKSKMLVMTFKAIFEQNWRTATPITKDTIESWGKNEFVEALKTKKKRK
jgi:predicted transcriptional regulator